MNGRPPAFEKVVNDVFEHVMRENTDLNLTRGEDGDYADDNTRSAYFVWNLAWDFRQEELLNLYGMLGTLKNDVAGLQGALSAVFEGRYICA